MSLAVLYNVVFVVGRAVFWEINKNAPGLWWTLDYLCDTIYVVDILVHCHEGKPIDVCNVIAGVDKIDMKCQTDVGKIGIIIITSEPEGKRVGW